MPNVNFTGVGMTKKLDEPDAIRSGMADGRRPDDYSARAVLAV
jgi:hypothetical protein